MASFITNKGAYELGPGRGTDFLNDTIKMVLLLAAAAPTRATNFISELTANELAGGGYARQTLAGKTVTEDDANNRVAIDANDPVYSGLSAGQTAGWAVMIRDTGNNATSPVLGVYDITDTPLPNGSLTLNVDPTGLALLTT